MITLSLCLILIKKISFLAVTLVFDENKHKFILDHFLDSFLNNAYIIMENVYLYAIPKSPKPAIFFSSFVNNFIFPWRLRIFPTRICCIYFCYFLFFSIRNLVEKNLCFFYTSKSVVSWELKDLKIKNYEKNT